MAPSLQDRLVAHLPQGVQLTIHHCSALPTTTDPLFVAAPGAKSEATELESHFLSASVRTDDGLVHAFAIEVLAYTTATLTTLFVSKADSTGYLHHLNLAPGTKSPIQTVIVQFLLHLIEAKRSDDHRLVLSLFARAQDQYLFPGSIENSKKHVLDDRGLIKWWARIIEGIFTHVKTSNGVTDQCSLISSPCPVGGFVVVPGIDAYEARSFIPRDADYKPSRHWTVGDPLATLGKPEGIPERCLIPRFPDDPKARFAIDLDDELPEPPKEGEGDREFEGKEIVNAVGSAERWRSVKSLAQFWELMSFRQECSAGRLVGFLWGVFTPPALVSSPYKATVANATCGTVSAARNGVELPATQSQEIPRADHGLPTPASSQQAPITVATDFPSLPRPITQLSAAPAPEASSSSQTVAPQVQTPAQSQIITSSSNIPPPVDVVESEEPPPLVKPAPAEIVLTPDAYARSMALLLTLDYCDLPTAIASTKKLLDAIQTEGGKESWGTEVTGTKMPEESTEQAPAGEVNSLAGLIRKRPKAEANTLSAGLVRKKPKTS